MKYSKYPSYKDSGVEWLGEVPDEWNVEKLKWNILRNDGGVWGNEPTGKSDITVLRSTEQTVDGYWKIKNPAIRQLTFNEIALSLLVENDLLVTKSSGSSLHIGKTTIVDKEIEELKCCYSNFMQRIRLTNSLNSKLGWYMMNNSLIRTQFDFLSNSTTGLANLNSTMMGEVIISTPSIQDQQAIVNYLDIATDKIDTLISKQTKLIELLKEKRQAVISRAVTRGLDNTVPMKDSGVEWLGEIPEHWKVGLLSSLFVSNKNKNNNLTNTNLLSLSYGKIIKKDIDSAKGLLPENFNSYQIVKEGYIVLRLTDLQNDKKSLRTGYVNEEGIITSAYIGLAKKSNSIGNTKYFHFYLHTFDVFKGFYGMGAGVRQGLNFDELKKLKFLLPPHDEQNKIVEYIYNKTSKIDNLLEKATKAIELLKEKRTALISSAVTGKIDVREAV